MAKSDIGLIVTRTVATKKINIIGKKKSFVLPSPSPSFLLASFLLSFLQMEIDLHQLNKRTTIFAITSVVVFRGSIFSVSFVPYLPSFTAVPGQVKNLIFFWSQKSRQEKLVSQTAKNEELKHRRKEERKEGGKEGKKRMIECSCVD